MLDVPAGIGASGSSSSLGDAPVGGPLSRLRHTMPTFTPISHLPASREHTLDDGETSTSVASPGGTVYLLKDRVSRTTVP